MRLRSLIVSLAVFLALLLAACGSSPKAAAPASTAPPAATPTASPTPTAVKSSGKELILATTTSTQDSGLLDVLVPLYEKATGDKVKVIAVGSGAALELGRKGNADVLLVHSPAAEEAYMKEGAGINRTRVMYNDFVIVGPAADPAKIKGMKDSTAAMKAIGTRRRRSTAVATTPARTPPSKRCGRPRTSPSRRASRGTARPGRVWALR